MLGEFRTVGVSSIVVRMAALLTMLLVTAYMSVLTFFANMPLLSFLVASTSAVTVAALGWRELVTPTHIIFAEGVVQLVSAVAAVSFSDGELVSLRPAFFAKWHRRSAPDRVVVRFNGGRRILPAAFPEFPLVLRELQRRNPHASIATD